jgi:hypothetical protein
LRNSSMAVAASAKVSPRSVVPEALNRTEVGKPKYTFSAKE